MRFIFRFPDIGEGISEGKILQWHVKKGTNVKSGDPLVKMETDKVVTDIPSPKDGVIVTVFGKEGEVINVEDPLVELDIEGVEGADAQKLALEKPAPPRQEVVEEKGFGVVGTIEVAGDAALLPSSDEGIPEPAEPFLEKPRKALATPVARAMAKDLGLAVDKIPGTGPNRRVTKKDIQLYYESLQKGTVKTTAREKAPEEPRIDYQPLTQIRKAIARNMLRSKQSTAHMTAFEEVEVSELIQLRNRHKEQAAAEGIKLTYMAFILKAVALALAKHPTLNSEMDLEAGRMLLKKYYNIGIAVDTEEGLVVPVIRDADRLSIRQLARKVVEIAGKARDRTLTLEDIKDGTFTITNYGSIAGTFGVPVINYPQAGILGIGRIMKVPVVKDNEVAVGNVLPLSLSVDHRIVDGGDAARFLLTVMGFLNDPVSLLLT